MPQIITLPGARSGTDNLFEEQVLTEGTHELAPGEKAYSSLFRLFWTDHSGASILNRGTIWNISPTNVSAAIGGMNLESVRNSGLIVSEAPSGNAYAISVGSRGKLVSNTGEIFAIARGNAIAITHWDPGVQIINSGLVAAYAPHGDQGGVGSAVGVAMYNGGFLDNRAGASILAEGLTATAVIFSRGDLLDPGPHIRNAGLIEAFAIDPGQESIGIHTAALSPEYIRIANSGIIRADIAYLSTSEDGYSPPQQPDDQFHNLAGGEVYGRIETRLGDDSVINAGIINGDLLMGEGADRVDTRTGQLHGTVHLDWGADIYLGWRGQDVVTGGRDGDRIEGLGGHDLLLGGLGDDVLIGGGGNDGLFGEHGDDRIIAGGGDVVDAGAGDDFIQIADFTFRSLSGGAGFDRLVLPGSADSLDLSAVRASGRLSDIEMLVLRGDQRLVIRSGDVSGLSGESTLRLQTRASDDVELIGGWKEISPIVIDGVSYRRFSNAGEFTLVAGRGDVTISAAPSAPADGLDPVAGGAVAPLPGAGSGAELSSVTTVLNHYDLHATETVQSYEHWRSQGGKPVLEPWDPGYSLINHGKITSSGPGLGLGGAKAIWIRSLDQIVNYGTIRAEGSGTSSADAIFGDGLHALVNYGVIEAVAQGGRAQGVSGGSFQNYGTISARTDGTMAASAASAGGDNALNAGRIIAVGGDGTVALSLGAQLFTNSGTIAAELAAGASGTTYGLRYGAATQGSTFVNHGLIRGDKAVVGSSFGTPSMAAFHNFGRIEGAVELADGHTLFENRGVVLGDVRLGGSGDLWLGEGGEHAGLLIGGAGGDIIVGSAAGDSLSGEGGNDYMRGGAGRDRLSGGAGRDLFAYTAVNDSTGANLDTILDFTSGTDRIDLSGLAVQSVSFRSQPGFTKVVATTASGTLAILVSGTVAMSDIILAPSAGVDGTANADLLVATAGGSTLRGLGGDDLLVGSADNDHFIGGPGNDVAWGGAGDDVYVFAHYDDVAWEVAGEGTDLILLGTSDLRRIPDNVENVTLLQAAYVGGNDLANTIIGSTGADAFRGQAGNDDLSGGNGNDRLIGGTGADRLTGGGGVDFFVFEQLEDSPADGMPDLITDFVSGTDRISLVDLRYAEGGSALFPAFEFIGTDAFSGKVGEVRYDVTDAQAHIFVDMNGDAIADLHIVAATESLLAGDFII